MDTDGRPLTKMGSLDILNWLVGTANSVWIDEVCGDGSATSSSSQRMGGLDADVTAAEH